MGKKKPKEKLKKLTLKYTYKAENTNKRKATET